MKPELKEVEREYQPKESDRVSVWRELNRGIVMSDEPLSFEEVNELVQI